MLKETLRIWPARNSERTLLHKTHAATRALGNSESMNLTLEGMVFTELQNISQEETTFREKRKIIIKSLG